MCRCVGNTFSMNSRHSPPEIRRAINIKTRERHDRETDIVSLFFKLLSIGMHTERAKNPLRINTESKSNNIENCAED